MKKIIFNILLLLTQFVQTSQKPKNIVYFKSEIKELAEQNKILKEDCKKITTLFKVLEDENSLQEELIDPIVSHNDFYKNIPDTLSATACAVSNYLKQYLAK